MNDISDICVLQQHRIDIATWEPKNILCVAQCCHNGISWLIQNIFSNLFLLLCLLIIYDFKDPIKHLSFSIFLLLIELETEYAFKCRDKFSRANFMFSTLFVFLFFTCIILVLFFNLKSKNCNMHYNSFSYTYTHIHKYT